MRIGSIVIRCYEFDRMVAFWQDALHYVPKAPPSGGWVRYPWRYQPGDDFVVLADPDDNLFCVVQA